MSRQSLDDITAKVVKSFAQYDQQGTSHWTWEVAAQDLIYQVGSLHKVMLQMSGSRWADKKSSSELEAQFRNELADILSEVLYIAHARGIDMNQAMSEMYTDDTTKVESRKK
jgi:hypothetical protein